MRVPTKQELEKFSTEWTVISNHKGALTSIAKILISSEELLKYLNEKTSKLWDDESLMSVIIYPVLSALLQPILVAGKLQSKGPEMLKWITDPIAQSNFSSKLNNYINELPSSHVDSPNF